jgi:hypothetical protein
MGSNISTAALVSRYRANNWYQVNPATGEGEVKYRPVPQGGWVPLAECDKSHEPEDAVSFWNREGYKHGPQSPVVRAWMNDPNNYIFEPSTINRSRGSRNDENYVDPLRV